ncbi:MAG: thiamine pyrophosphate-binding protein [Nitrospinota bacterium]
MVKGSDLIVECLIEAGVKHVFGLTGTTILDITDSLIKRQDEIKYVGARHESAAAHMADGYARATGKPGVCISHVGPGAFHLLYGVAVASKESSPLVAITGNESSPYLGRDIYHELDILSLSRPITKWNAQARGIEEIPRLLRHAFTAATTGKPGPVHLDIPKDVSRQAKELSPDFEGSLMGSPEGGFAVPAIRGRAEQRSLSRCADLIRTSRRPVIHVGSGLMWSGASPELARVAETVDVPVITTDSGRGSLAEDHPNFIGVVGRAVGDESALERLKAADLVLAIGLTFSDVSTLEWTAIGRDARIVQVDIEPREVGRQYPVTLGIVADAKLFLDDLVSILKSEPGEVSEERKRWRAEARAAFEAGREAFFNAEVGRGGGVPPHKIIGDIAEVISRDAFFSVGIGVHSFWGKKVPVYNPKSYIRSGGLGAMGFAYPAMLGAKVAHPERQAIAFVGDGDFMMSVSEVETAVRNGLGVVAIIFNNFAYGSQKLHQRRTFGGRFIGTDHANPDFANMARLFGAEGARVEKPGDFKPALKEMLAKGRPGIIDVLVDPLASPASWAMGSGGLSSKER